MRRHLARFKDEIMIIKNANIFTAEHRFVKGDAAVADGRFADPSDWKEEDGKVLDAEGLYMIPGLVDIHVNIDALPSSNADLMLDTTFESAEALKGYSTHPAHVAVADSKVRPYYKNRVCLDYEV